MFQGLAICASAVRGGCLEPPVLPPCLPQALLLSPPPLRGAPAGGPLWSSPPLLSERTSLWNIALCCPPVCLTTPSNDPLWPLVFFSPWCLQLHPRAGGSSVPPAEAAFGAWGPEHPFPCCPCAPGLARCLPNHRSWRLSLICPSLTVHTQLAVEPC